MSRIVDITGNRYDRLKVLSFHHSENNRSYWLCECDCNKLVVLRKDHFAYGFSHQKSCGCLHRELSSARMKRRHEQARKRRIMGEEGKTHEI